jgi:hypothetical protein
MTRTLEILEDVVIYHETGKNPIKLPFDRQELVDEGILSLTVDEKKIWPEFFQVIISLYVDDREEMSAEIYYFNDEDETDIDIFKTERCQSLKLKFP